MGFNIVTFDSILESEFEDHWNTTPIPQNDVSSSGIPYQSCHSLDAAGALCLVLHYITSTMLNVSLMQIFDLIPSMVSQYINFTIEILLQTLQDMPDAKIQWLAGEEFQQSSNLIMEWHPLLDGGFGSMDGLNLTVQTSTDQEIENATYNG